MRHILLLLYKMFNNLSPEYPFSLIPPTVNNISRNNLRNAQNIQTKDSRTTQYFNSFLQSSIREWYNLSLDVRNSDSVFIFKRKVNSDIRTISRYFYAGNRRAQILHTRYGQSVAHLTMTYFRNVSMIYLSVSMVMWSMMITTFCVVNFIMHR